MHLTIVSPYPPIITGIGQYGYHVSRLLASSGVFSKISVLCGQADSLNKIKVSPEMELLEGWRPGQWDAGWRIASHLRQMKPDVVWFNLGVSVFGKSPLANLSGFLGPAGAHLLDLPNVVTLHELPELTDLRELKAPGGVFSLYGARILSRLAIRADVVCLTMQRYADWLSTSQPGPRYLHVPTGAYYPPELLPEPTVPELLFFSTIAPFKGLETLLKAFQFLQPTYPGLRLTIAGARHIRFPDYPERLKARFGHLTGIRWLDQVPETKVRSLFERASLVVLPYQASTGASSVLMQTAAWGRAVVASDLEEIRGLASENGLETAIFERGNVPALVESLKRQLDSAALRQAQVRQNFAAIQQYRPERLCTDYLKAFNLALEAHRSSHRIKVPSPSTTEPV
jgi:glycosyltransferase involved in cell wall biosynthesis